MRKVIMSSVLALSLIAVPSFAGNSGHASQAGQSSQSEQSSQAEQSSQSSQASQANQGGCHKPCFLSKIKKSFQKGFQAGKKAGTKAHDAIQNKVMDTGVAIKKAVTCKKNKTFVKGHYRADGTHVKGHWRTVESSCSKR